MKRREFLVGAAALTAVPFLPSVKTKATMPERFLIGGARPDLWDCPPNGMSRQYTERQRRYKYYEKCMQDPWIVDRFYTILDSIEFDISYTIDDSIKFLDIHSLIIWATVAVYGDLFLELIRDYENKMVGAQILSPHTVYRIQTVSGKLLEFQQGKEGPDYGVVGKDFCTIGRGQGTDVIRFRPEDIVHFRLGVDFNGQKSHWVPCVWNCAKNGTFGREMMYGTSMLEFGASNSFGEKAFWHQPEVWQHEISKCWKNGWEEVMRRI